MQANRCVFSLRPSRDRRHDADTTAVERGMEEASGEHGALGPHLGRQLAEFAA